MRDWGHAKDYVEMQWLMLQQEEPEDFVIATGRQASVRNFVELCAKELKWSNGTNKSPLIWENNGIDEIGRRRDNGKIVIRIDPRYFRLTEVETLLGDATKARKKLGWVPQISLEKLIKEMISNDINEAEKEKILKAKGFEIFSPLEGPS